MTHLWVVWEHAYFKMAIQWHMHLQPSLQATYVQIKKELLSVFFGVERFEGYVCRRKFFVQTDHKPLESLMKKSLLSAPKRLKRMLLQLRKFDLEVAYSKGIEIYIADPLSRAYLLSTNQNEEVKEDVWNVNDIRSPTKVAAEYVDIADFVPIRQVMLSELKAATETDAELELLTTVIKQGWPENLGAVPLPKWLL